VAHEQGIGRSTLGPNDAAIDRELARRLVPRRDFGAHKWGIGGLVVVAGAPGYTGAAILSALAAGRNGAGIMNVALPRSLSIPVTIAVPEAATLLLSDGDPRRSVDAIEEKLEKSTAILIGPGLSEDDAAGDLLSAIFGLEAARSAIGFGVGSEGGGAAGDGGLLGRADKPVVLDADALNWLAKQSDWPSLIPRAVRFSRRTSGKCPACSESQHPTSPPIPSRRFAERRLNGARPSSSSTVTPPSPTANGCWWPRTHRCRSQPRERAMSSPGPSPPISLRDCTPMDAAALAIYVGMRAARRVEERFGTLGVVAGDLPDAMAEELAALEREGGEEAS
jgi:NAD(P)H-hydrate epimerase